MAILMHIPGTPMTSIFEGQSTKTKPSNQNKGHLGSRYIHIHLVQSSFDLPNFGDGKNSSPSQLMVHCWFG